MAGIYSQGGSAGHRYAGWLSEVEAKNFIFGGKVFNGSPSAIYVGSNLVWMGGWLEKAAQQAILGAFGQRDGWAVIKATNAYLNQLAASDMDKATALAALINEDPMMVCSLGLEVEGVTMPIRWLNNNFAAYLDLDFKTTGSAAEVNCLCKINARKTSALFGNCLSSPFFGIYLESNATKFMIYCGNAGNRQMTTIDLGTPYTIQYKANGNLSWSINSTTGTLSNVGNVGNNTPFQVFRYTYNGNLADASMSYFNYEDSAKQLQLVPFIHQGANGMIDTITGTFYPNANSSGSFTIEYTLPDGTPWTPSTP